MLKANDTHKDFNAKTEYWKRARDTYAGELVMHGEEETYLPRLDKQTDTQYASYLKRARYFNAVRRTVDGLTGLVFRKDPISKVEGIEDFSADVTFNQQSLTDYSQEVLREALTTGAGGTLVDFPKAIEGLTVAQAEELNMRPLLKYYSAENVRNWRYKTVNNVSTLVEVTLRETYESEDGEERVLYRQLLLQSAEEGQPLSYIQVITRDDPGIGEQKEEMITPKGASNELMTFIPFVFHRTVSGIHYELPPLTDLIDANIHHYQLKADHAHGLRYVALPTPYITGTTQPKDEDGTVIEMSIGPQEIWFIPDAQSKVGFLEFTGAGLKAYVEELTTLEEQMAQMGARVMQPQQSASPITATASLIGSQGETSLLTRITNIISTEVSTAVQWAASWMGKDNVEDYGIELSTDFLPANISAQDLTALVNSWLQGAISKETLFINLQQGEVVPADADYQDEEDKIAADLPEPVEKEETDEEEEENPDTGA